MKNKNSIKICLVILPIVFVFLTFFVLSTSYSNFKKILGQVDGSTYNNGVFSDYNMYTCVIDNFNSLNGSNIDYNTNLSDEDLASITTLTCEGKNISNTQGIEKLTNLVSLNLKNNNIEEVNLNNNKLIEQLNLSYNSLSYLDLITHENLILLNAEHNNISNIFLKKSYNLKELYLNDNRLSTVILKNNANIENLFLQNNKIEFLDLSNNEKLLTLNFSGNDFLNIAMNEEETFDLNDIIKLPSNLYEEFPYFNSDVINNIENRKVTSISAGEFEFSQNIFSSSYSLIFSVNYKVTVKPLINTNKYSIRDNYIFTYADINPNTIKNNIDVGLNISKEIDEENSKLKLYKSGKFIKEYTIVNYSSSKYDLTKDYIYYKYDKLLYGYGTNDLIEYIANDIRNKITCNNCDVSTVKDDYGFYERNLIIKTGGYTLKNFKLLFAQIDDSEFDLTKDTIVTGFSGTSYPVIGGDGLVIESNENSIVAKYNDEILQTWKIAKTNISSEYFFDENERFIYTKNDSDEETILNNITIDTNYFTSRIHNNTFQLLYNGKVKKEYKLIYYNTDYDLSNGYLYLRSYDFDESKIDVKNGSLSYEEYSGLLFITYVGWSYHILDTIPVVKMSSQKYDLTNDYIYLGTKDFINDITFTNPLLSAEVKDDKLVIMYDNNPIMNKYFVKISSNDEYKITDNYVYISDKQFKDDYIGVTNGYCKRNNDIIQIYYKNDSVEQKVAELDLAGIKLLYSLDNDYIYLKNNPEKIYGEAKYINTELEYKNGTITIRYSDTKEELEKKEVVYLTSDKYDLSNKYIYLGNQLLNISDIKIVNASLKEENNNLNVYYKNEVIDGYKLVKVLSNNYEINNDNIFITSDFDIEKIYVTNAIKEYKNNKLYIIYDNIQKVFDIKNKNQKTNTNENNTRITTKKEFSETINSNDSSKNINNKTTLSNNKVAITTVEEIKHDKKNYFWLIWLIIIILIIIGIIIYLKEKKESEERY